MAVQAFARLDLRRATRATAAAPNSRTIGGAGTLTPLLELVEELDDEALDVLEALDELLDVLVPPPKLDEDVLVDAVKIALPVLPPKKAPLKNPPPKLLPPPLDPTTATPLLPPLLLTTGGRGGRGGA